MQVPSACLLFLFMAVHGSNAFADTDEAIMARMKSCDPRISLAAAKEVLEDPKTSQDPTRMFSPAYFMYMHGNKDEAVFWFYAAQLRFRYIAAIAKGDYEQVLSIFVMTTGTAINNYAFQDVARLERILDDVLAWDKATPNPFKERVTSPEAEAEVRKVYVGLDEMKAKLRNEKDELEKAAKLADADVQGRQEQIHFLDCPDLVGEFDGAWGVEICAPNQKKDECGGFYLYLVNRLNRVCGDHSMATPGLGRLNGGGPRSVVGPVFRKSATLQVTSGRDGTRVRGLARRVDDTIEWKPREALKKGDGAESPLIGDNLILTRRTSDEALKRVADECKGYFDSVAR